MAIFYSDKAQGLTPAATAAAGAPQGTSPAITAYSANEIITVEGKVTIPVTYAANDSAVMVLLPAGHVPVDLLATFDDLDDNASVTVSACVLDDTLAAQVASTDFFTSESTVPRVAGVVRANVAAGLRLAASAVDRWVGLFFTAGAGTGKAGTATLVLTYRASNGD
jgi:hypothetical protein